MGRSQRDKGKRGERDAAKAVRESLGLHARRGVQYQGLDAQDLSVEAEGIHWEVKFVEREAIRSWMSQAESDAEGKVPVVLHRKSRQPWLLTLPLDRAYEFFVRLEEARSQAVQAVEPEAIPCPLPDAVLPPQP